jgi:hypothetical protein
MGGSTLHRRHCLRAWTLAASVGWGFVPGALFGAPEPGVGGRVFAAADPVEQATVYVYQVVERTLQKVLTDSTGRFHFSDLPAGLYKLIAHKGGFAPAVVVLTRRAAEESQFVQLDLAAETRDAAPSGFWELRSEVPGDVLRELDLPGVTEVVMLAAEADESASPPAFLAEVAASTTVADLPTAARGQMVAGELGLEGRLGGTRLSLEGDYRSLASDGAATNTPAFEGEAAALHLRLDSPAAGRFDLATSSESLVTLLENGENPIDFQNLTLSYRRDLGEHGSTVLLAQYVDESGLNGGRQVRPANLPLTSRALRVEGAYHRQVGDSTNLRTGLRYRESLRDYVRRSGSRSEGVMLRTLDAWGAADWELDSTYVVQYGVFATAHDGSVSLAPQGGLVVRFRPEWQASVRASRRLALTEEDPLLGEFRPATLDSALGCADAEASCYELQLARSEDGAESFRLGGSWREFDRTLRLFLRDDFLASGEGLFLVPGDRLPEAHVTFAGNLGGHVRASWTSTYAEGGGGAFVAANRRSYTNDVSYLSTELDASIRPTSTGVYVAFHRVTQDLRWIPIPGRRGSPIPPSAELERVEVAVSQNLSSFLELSTDWAVRLGVELLRGGTLFQSLPVDEDDLRHRVTTGVAVRF